LIADPHLVATTWSDPKLRAIAAIAIQLAVAPWAMSRGLLERGHAAGLTDEHVVQIIYLGALFGHLNRIADAVAVPLDYAVQLEPPRADPTVPALAAPLQPIVGRPALDLSRRATTAAAIAEWRRYMFDRDAPLTRRQRTVIARWVAAWLGDGGISPPGDLTVNPLDDALMQLSRIVTLAPWQLSAASFGALRAAGFDDAAVFDACATASTAGVLSRIEVASIALGQ
jgi:alkylhydroperoxidase family enzyme